MNTRCIVWVRAQRGRHRTPLAFSIRLATVVAMAAFGLALSTAAPTRAATFSGTGWDDLIQANEPVVFSVMGDMPYGTSEISEFQQQIDQHDLYSPSEFLTHLGDIKSGSEACSSDRYQTVANIMKSSQVPCYIVPGDNETTDCTNPTQGWSYWTQYLLRLEQNWACSPSTERQSGRTENFAYVHKGMLFIGINLVGGSNDTNILEDDADWVVQQLQTKASQVRGAVIFAQAGPGSNHSTFFNPFVSAAQTFAKPILYIHGDGHSWVQDQPFSANNVIRVQVEAGGSELPVQVTATLNTTNMFTFKRNPWSGSSTPVTRPPCGPSTPMLAISDVTALEGNAGITNAVFTVTLTSPVSGQTVTVQYASANGSATAGTDYTAVSGSLSLSSTATSRTVTVGVNGDLDIEPDESFYVDLSNATNAGIADSRGQGTIRTDDGNRLPVARSDDYATNEDVALNVPAPGVLGNDGDADGDPLTVSLQSGTSNGSLVLNANGSFTYTPSANFSGSDEFTYMASDGRGGTATAAVTLSVVPVNDVPSVASDTYTTPVGTMLVVPVPGVLANDSDPDGDMLTVELVTWPQFGSLTMNTNGSFTYSPVAGFDGVDSFTYRVRDPLSVSTSTTVKIGVGGPVSATYNPLADAYVSSFKPSNNYGTGTDLRTRAGSRNERPYLRFQVSGFRVVASARLRLYVTDSSSDGGSVYAVANTYAGTTTPWTETGLVWTNAPVISGTPIAATGQVTSGQWEEITLTPAVTGDGTYCFALSNTAADVARYTSREGTNKPQLIIERGNVTNVPGNQAPVAVNDSHSVTEDIAFSAVAPGVLGNDSDPDGDAMNVAVASAPAHGSLTLQANGSFTYTPAANWNGTDGFTYSISDGRGGSATGTVSLPVAAVNDVPAAQADAWSIARDGVLNIAAPGVLANDSDADGNPLTVAQIASPTNGSLSLAADGSFTYAPNAGYSGSDSFTYRASDGTAQSAETTVSLSVTVATGAVTFVESQTGGAAASTTVSTTAPLGGTAGDLYLAAVASKSLRSVTTVTGLGLTWTHVRAQCSGRSQTGVEIWRARGNPTPGVVTATLASSAENAVIFVARYAGSDATTPLGNIVSGNSNGANGVCVNGIDSGAFSFPLTTQGGIAFGATAQRSHIFTPGSGWSQLADARMGTGGTAASLTAVERATTAGTTTFDGSFSSSTDWAAVAVEIRPSGAATKIAAAEPPAEHEEWMPVLERVFPNPTRELASIAYELRAPAAVELVVYNARGQRVRALRSSAQAAGRHMLHWDTRDHTGMPVPAGIYFVRMQLGERVLKQKLVVQR